MVIVAALVLSAGGTQPSAALPIAPAEGLAQEPPGRKSFHADRAMRHVRRLAGRIGVRLRATRGERRGASYVAKKLRAYGYRVRVPTFSVDGRTSRNVVARWPGSRRRAIVIGAHIDSVRGSPGANDNASGVAVMLELARVFADAERRATSASSGSGPRSMESTAGITWDRTSTCDGSAGTDGAAWPGWCRSTWWPTAVP